MKKYLLIPAIILMLNACTGEEEEKCVFTPDVSAIDLDVTIGQYQDSFVNVQSKRQLVDLLTRLPVIRDHVFLRHSYPDDSVFINTLYERFTNPHMDTLLQETHRVFGNLSELEAEFEQAFKNLKYYYPDFQPPVVQTVITGLIDSDLFLSDSLIVISLDYFLGEGAKYRPKMYNYLLRQYRKENIVPSVMLLYAMHRYNKTDLDDMTVLADMIAYGKSYYFAKHMLPCVPDSILIWYTAEEIQGSRKNQHLIWARLIEDQVLYSTSHLIKQRYLGERPKTTEVGEKCPGRIGQWVGWQIVNKYMETHPRTTLQELMNIADAQKLFKESGYRPEKR